MLLKYRNVRATNEKRNDEAVNIASALIETNLDELIPQDTADWRSWHSSIQNSFINHNQAFI